MFNVFEIHLRLNHFPIIGLMVVSAMFIHAYFFKKKEIIAVCKVGFILLSLMTVPVYNSGNQAEELVEHKPGYDSEEMEEHEEHAEQAFYAILALGAFSLFTFIFRKNEKISSRLNAILVPASLIVIFLMVLTGYHGGKIKHNELESAASQLQPAESTIEEEGED